LVPKIIPFTGLCFTANTAGSTVELTKVGSPGWTGYYSLNSKTWMEYQPGETGIIPLANAGDKVYFKGDYATTNDTSSHLQFVMTGSIAASGNTMSLLSSDYYY